MQPIRFALFSLLAIAAPAFAHPGHGKPGIVHEHSFLDLLIAAAPLALLAIGAIALAVWIARRAR